VGLSRHAGINEQDSFFGYSRSQSQSGGTGSPTFPMTAPGDYEFSFKQDDLERSYRVHIPLDYDPSVSYPVLFGFHGGFGNAEQFARSTHLSELADQRGFIAVYGQGTSWGVLQAPVWNAGDCCGRAVDSDKNVDDVGYAREVIEEIKKKYHVDSSRIYMTGMSNGGMLVQRLACEASDLFSGAATVSGTIGISTCRPARQMPIFIMHGTNDENVPYEGGRGSKAVNGSSHIPVEQEFADWAARNACTGAVSTSPVVHAGSDGKSVDRLSNAHCAEPVVLYRVNNGVHEWPGGMAKANALERPTPTSAIDTSKTIVDFFGL